MRAFLIASILAVSPPGPEPVGADLEPEPSAESEVPEGVEAAPGESLEPQPDPAVGGCAKDTDCKGARICDAATRLCVDPVTASVAEPEPAQLPVPQVQRDEGPPTWYRSATPTRTHHPYVAGGATMIVLGVAAIAGGGAWLGVYKSKAKAASASASSMLAWESTAKTDAFVELAERGPKVYAGSGILISSGAVLFIAGIVLAAIEEPVSYSVTPSAGGLTVRF